MASVMTVKVSMSRKIRRKICALLCCGLTGLLVPGKARAETGSDLQTLEMFYEGKDLAVSATRSPKPLSQTAENVTIVTAAEIEMMGAHTLVDVLANIPGIQASDRGGPGNFFDFSIQGAVQEHILVMLDGVRLNFFGGSEPDLGIIPVQHIERIEIIKGPASSSWGSALGGVVNIVTKSPDEERKAEGTASFFGGEKETRDSRGELTGTLGRFGYYLYGGNLTTNGFRPNTAADLNNLFAKLRWDLPERGSIQFTLAYDRGVAGDGDTRSLDYISKLQRRYLLSTLGLAYRLTDSVDLDISLRTTVRRVTDSAFQISPSALLPDLNAREKSYGGSAKLTWREGVSTLVMGTDFDHLRSASDANVFAVVTNLYSEKYGVFLNDTLAFGPLAVTPGIRYDRMRPVGDFWSPSLGAAWSLNDKTILRAYAARGYSLPILIANSTQEKVVTLQAGAETSQVPYLWLKATLFRNYLSDVQGFDAKGNVTLEKHQKQGFELEGKTLPLFNTSLVTGYTFIETKDRDTGQALRELGIPRQIAKLGLHYNDRDSFRASLLARYVWFNAAPEYLAKDNAVIWDLNLAKKFTIPTDRAAEIFFNAHNLFNGAQYSADVAKNARRWLEGGVRFSF
jgi:vitamin B12 transporter